MFKQPINYLYPYYYINLYFYRDIFIVKFMKFSFMVITNNLFVNKEYIFPVIQFSFGTQICSPGLSSVIS